MLSILPILALALLIRFLYDIFRRDLSYAPWRLAILGGATLWGTCIVLITEGLSLFHALTRGAVAASWAAACFALGYTLFRQLRKNRGTECPSHIEERSHFNPEPCRRVPGGDFTVIERISLFGLAAIAFFTLIIVLVAAPNNWDSLTYHLPRIMHWIQNRNVSFYVTPDARQLCFPPWSEYHILQYQILLEGDRLAALPQWLSFVGACVASSLAAKFLGANRSIQIFAATLTGCIPMAILQSTSTQNDLTGGFWLLTAICFGLLFARRLSYFYSALFGLAVGLAVLSKTTLYLYTFPFIFAFVFWAFVAHRLKAIPFLLAAGLLALAINCPLYSRNIALCGNPLGDGPHYGISLKNRNLTVKTLASNGLRNAGLQFLTPSNRINSYTERGIRFIHNLIGANIDDPATTFLGNRYETKWLSTCEDDAANPIQFILGLMFLPLSLILLPRGPERIRLGVLSVCILIGAALFCLLLQWQPWHSRQHTALFLCAAPLIAVAVSRLPAFRFWTGALTVLLLLASIPYVFGNETRPILFPMTPDRFQAKSVLTTPRKFQYLRRDFPLPWTHAFDQIKKERYKTVGLSVHWFSCEYPIWLLASEGEQPPRMEQVCVTNMPTTVHQRQLASDFTPDVILRFSDGGSLTLRPGPESITLNGVHYSLSWEECDPMVTNMCARLYVPDHP